MTATQLTKFLMDMCEEDRHDIATCLEAIRDIKDKEDLNLCREAIEEIFMSVMDINSEPQKPLAKSMACMDKTYTDPELGSCVVYTEVDDVEATRRHNKE